MTRVAAAVLVAWLVLALFADLIASELPLAVRVDGQTWLLPALGRPNALRGETHATLAPRAEWLVRAPVPFGPLQTVVTLEPDRAGAPPWGPDARHLLGTDEIGRDVLSRLIHGARVTLLVAFGVVLLSTALGVVLGALAGLKGGVIDLLISRLIEVASTFPTIFFLMVIVAALRAPSLWAVVLVLAATRWIEAARLMRAEVQRLAGLDFVQAARALGASELHVLLVHLVPNALRPVGVSATFAVGTAVLLESGLSFLGLSVPPPGPTWGELLVQAHRTLVHPGAWWLALFPGLAIASVVLATQAVGHALQRRFDGRA
ncbi:MAG: ABC transporter permease [Myxococcaceae bacterium]|jgi:peptide/nickel transport system permease protein|nr:ABC transporter permease [Myxococcaceae bacterium]